MPQLTESQRVKAVALRGVISCVKVAQLLGVNERTIRRAWNPDSERMHEASRRRERKRRGTNGAKVAVATVDYRAKGLGPGKNALCPCCGRRYTEQDFQTDIVTGRVLEPTMCWRCVA